MGKSSNQSKKKMARERGALKRDKQKKLATGGFSQLDSQKKSMNIVCSVCKQAFMSTSRVSDLQTHIDAKHKGKLALKDAFPEYEMPGEGSSGQ